MRRKRKEPALSEAQANWNKMWLRWAYDGLESPFQELMTYQSEVENGGHAQYFSTLEDNGEITPELSMLEQILSEELMSNLRRAHEAYLLPEDDPDAERILAQCDALFETHNEEITKLLQGYASALP